MQGGRRRNPNDDRRRGYDDRRGYSSSGYRKNGGGGGGGSFSRKASPPPPLPPPPPRRREEILIEAGRLAAEYLVYRGLLPASSLPSSKRQDREPHAPGRRISALDRLGDLNSDDVHGGRRRLSDECDDDRGNSRYQYRGRTRTGPYDRESDWDRGRDGRGRWGGRNQRYNDMGDDVDFASRYHRDGRSGVDQLPSRSENTVESGSNSRDVAEDTGSKVSSSSARRDPPSKGVDLVAGEEVKSVASGDWKKSNLGEELDAQEIDTEGCSKSGDEIMNLHSFAPMSTRPQSPTANKSPKIDQEVIAEASNMVEDSLGEPKATLEEVISGGPLNNSQTNQTETETQTLAVEAAAEHKGTQNPQFFEMFKATVDQAEDGNNGEGRKRQRDSSSEDEFTRIHNVRAKQLRQGVENPSSEDEKVTSEMEKQPLNDALAPNVEIEPDDKLEEEEQLPPASFKICDLNLIQAPDVTEVPDDSDIEHLHSSGPSIETGTGLSMDFGLSIGSYNSGADDLSRPSGDDKEVQLIDLEDDLTVEAGPVDPSRPTGEATFPNLDSFLNQPEHADLPSIQDGYPLEISEFYGSDMSQCPPVLSDLDNMETGMGLHDSQGIPNDDDSIYVSLGEIPIGFMEVWDHQPQEYGKFF